MGKFDLPTYLDTEGNWASSDNVLTGGLYVKPNTAQASQTFEPGKISVDPFAIPRAIIQGTAQSGAKLGLGLYDIAKGNVTPTALQLDPQASRLEETLFRGLFGTDRVSGFTEDVVDYEQFLQPYLGESSKLAVPPLLVGLTALDFATGGNKRKLVDSLVNANTLDETTDILRRIGATEDSIKTFGKRLTKTTDPNEIEKALVSMDLTGGIGKERKFLTSVKKQAEPGGTLEGLSQMKVAGQYISRGTDALAIRAKNLIKDNLTLAEKKARDITDEGVATASELLKYYSKLADNTTDNAAKEALYDREADIAHTTARNLTEAGRTVQAASILSRLTPEGQLRFAAREIERYNRAVRPGKRIPGLTKDQTKYVLNEQKAINAMAEGEAKAMRHQKLQNYILDLVPSSLMKKLVSVWKAGLLTGLKTTGVNIFANTSHAISEVVKDIPAVAADSVMSLFTGKRTKAFTTAGLGGGLKNGFEKGWRYLRTGYDERDMLSKLDYKRVNFGKGPIARAIKMYEQSVFRLLGAEDQPFYYGAKARSLVDQATAQAINNGLKGSEKVKFVEDLVANPTDDMIKLATADAETAVFQNKTKLSEAASGLQRSFGGAGEFIVPFGRTPSAVAMQIINYSPVGIVKEIVASGIRGLDQRKLAEAIGRGLTGTAVIGLGSYLYSKGLVTLDRPTTESELARWYAEGKQPNSIKVNGKWRQSQVLGPLGNALLVGGQLQKAYDKTGSVLGSLLDAGGGTIKAFTEQTFLTGLNSAINTITDPERSASMFVSNLLASTVPTIVGDVARAIDDVERKTTFGITDRLKAKVPFLRERLLQPAVDILGRERGRVAGSPIATLIDPTRPSLMTGTSVTTEIARLVNTGHNITTTQLGDKNGFPVLTPEQNTALWKRAGQIASHKIDALIKTDTYKNLSETDKAKAVQQFYNKSQLYARVEMVLKLTEGLQGQALLGKLKELKTGRLLTEEVFNEYQKLR